MPVYTGPIEEQWAEAGLDVTLGLITAAELHALGQSIIVDRRFEDRDTIRQLRHELRCSEEDVTAEREVTDRERERRRTAEDKLATATNEIATLKKQVAELERTIRGLQQPTE